MAEIEKKEQQNASFAANYIDETIKADSDSRAARLRTSSRAVIRFFIVCFMDSHLSR